MLKSFLSSRLAEILDLNPNHDYVEYPRDVSHGDYASPIALRLGKEQGRNPHDVAVEIAKKLEATDLDGFAKLEIAGPGFINFRLNQKGLLKELNGFLAAPRHYRLPTPPKNNKIICEYSDPNIAKPLGIHHLLATVIGQSLANIYTYLGYEVIKIHIGDWGTQFGKLIYAIKQWGDRSQIDKNPIDELLKLYVKFHEEATNKPEIEDLGRTEFKHLEDGDTENRALWKWIVEISMTDVQKTYDLLGGITFDHVLGESFYEKKMAPLIEQGLKEGIFEAGEGGAIIANFPGTNYPTTIIKRSDGATVYITRDIATVQYRVDTWHPAKIVYVVDVAQKLHFEQVFHIAKRLGLYTPTEVELEHVIFGRMSFADKKMSTRKGNILLLDDVLLEAIDRAQAVVEDKNPDLPADEKRAVAEMVGVGGVKYAILSQNRMTNIIFSWDKVINLQGNSAAYLQYTYARARSIINEFGTTPLTLTGLAEDLTENEKEVLRLIPKFPEAVVLAAKESKPHFISEYLFDLAQAFNGFYNNDPILKAPKDKKDLRIAICDVATQIIKQGLSLLATIDAPERM